MEQRRVRAVELLLHERGARLAVAIGDRHAPRVVHEHAEEILLRHRRFEDERRAEQAEQQHGERRQPQADENRAVARTIGRRHAAIREQRQDGDRRHRPDDQQHGARQAPAEVPLLKQQRRILEKEAKEFFQHLALILMLRASAGATLLCCENGIAA